MMRKKVWIRLGCMLLMTMLLLPCGTALGMAKEIQWIEIKAYAAQRGISGTLTLLQVDGDLCIYSEDARVLSGADHYIYDDDKGHRFSFGAHRVYPDMISYRYGTRVFFPLKELMDALGTRYFYDETSQQIIFIPCMSFSENLKNDCMEIFCNGLFDAEQMESTIGVAASALYNILGGLRVDVLWGGYQREQIEEVVAGVMYNDGYSDALEWMSDADEVLGKVATLVDFNKTDIDGIEHACTLMSVDYDGFAEAYDVLSNGVDSFQGIGLGTVLEVAQRIEAVQNANELYVNAVRIGLQQNPSVKGNLKRAVNEICAYYDEHRPTFLAIVEDISSTVLMETADELADTFAEKALREVILLERIRDGKLFKLNVNELYVEVAKLAMDSLGMEEMTKAVEHTAVCRYMQQYASESFHDSMDNTSRVTDPLQMKYSTILYLRLAEYAWSTYIFDRGIGHLAQSNVDACKEAMRTLTAYDDEELVMTVNNEKLDLNRMRVQISEQLIPTPTPVQQDSSAEPKPNATATPRPPKEFLFSDSVIADGEYVVKVYSEEISDTPDAWVIHADVYEYLCVDGETLEVLEVGDTIEGYAVTRLERDRWSGVQGYVLRISEDYYLMQGSDGMWYLHMRDDDLLVLKECRDREIEILRGKAKLYDNFTYLAYGQGSEMRQVTYLTDFFDTPYYRDGGQRPLELTLTVETGIVTKVVWNYRP